MRTPSSSSLPAQPRRQYGAVRIFKTYGSDAIQVMSENPYRLARDIRGIGFKTADAIAMKLGIEKTALIRVRDRVGETPCIFLAGLYRAERTIAEHLARLANGTLPWPWIDPDKALPWVGKRIGLALAESQLTAIRLALMAKMLVMTGGPGVGKTTIVKAIWVSSARKGSASCCARRPGVLPSA
jgi:exodeoxyribonuclease V alpha subunit